jgi:hypothetical protein
MADLSDFQEDAVEMISRNDEAPATVVRIEDDGSIEMLLHEGNIGPGPNPQFDLLAAYVAQLAERNDLTVGEVFERVDGRLAAWNEQGRVQAGENPENGEDV